MKAFQEYWTFSAIRGALTLVVAAGIVILPQAAAAIVTIPVMAALAIDVLAVYCLLDAGAVFLLATVMPSQVRSRRLLYAQVGGSIVLGATLYFFTYGAIAPKFLMLCLSVAAGLAAVIEFNVARDTHTEYGCLSCYSTALALAACASVLPFAGSLDAAGTSLALAGFAAVYGSSQLMLAARMLFLEYRAGHPAAKMSMVWKMLMQQAPPAPQAPACTSCDECPAGSVCRDDSPETQLVSVMQSRQPSIVRSVRAYSLMEPSGIYRAR